MTLKAGSRIAWTLIVIGALITLGSGAAGFVWLNRVPDFDAVPFGEQTQITATDSGPATIYTSTGLDTTPVCVATSSDGEEVVLDGPQRYQQAGEMESSYGFTAAPGLTYTVTCGDAHQSGRFGVAEVSEFPQAAFLAVGSAGLALSAAAVVLAWRRRSAPVGAPA
jgi:hypothetical protein